MDHPPPLHLHRRALVLGIGLGLGLAAPHAAARDAGVRILPETVVTAASIPVDAATVGSAISVIEGETLERRQVRIASDALRTVPGVAVSRGGSAGALTQVRIRGGESNHTLVIVDGIEVTDPSNFASEFDFANLLTHDIERIEVLRGPQSAVWGGDAVAGVVNVVTRRGEGPLRLQASAEGGSFATGQFTTSVSGGGERYHFRLSGAHLLTDGVSAARGGKPDGFRNTSVSFRGGLSPTSNLDIDVVGRVTRGLAEYDDQIRGVVVDADNELETHQRYGRLSATLALFDGAWEQSAGAALTSQNSQSFTNRQATFGNQGRKTRLDYRSTVFFQTPTVARADHSVSLVLEQEHEEFVSGGAFAPVGRTRSPWAIGGEYRVGLWDQLFLSGALRHDNNDIFENERTYRITGAWQVPGTGTRLHGSLGTGVKPPTFFELFGFGPNFRGNQNLAPEKSRGWDIGVEQSFLGARAIVDATWFENDVSNLISGFGQMSVNLPGTSPTKGVELSGRARLTDTLDLSASYTWSMARDPDGFLLARRPRHTASAALSWRYAGDRGSVDLGATFVGARRDLDFRPAFPAPAVQTRLSSYTLVNLAARFRVHPGVEVFGRVENLLNQDYQEVFGFSTPGIGAFAGVRLDL